VQNICTVCVYTVNRLEIESLISLFKQQTKQPPKAKLDRPKFRDVLHNQFDMTDDLIMDRGDFSFCVLLYNTLKYLSGAEHLQNLILLFIFRRLHYT